MKLKKSNLSTKLYLWFYQLELEDLPTNLCPYFWKLVTMYVFIIPYSIFCLPSIIWELRSEMKNEYDGTFFTTAFRIVLSIGIYIVLFLAFIMIFSISLFWTTYDPKTEPFYHSISRGGVLMWIGSFCAYVIFRIDRWTKYKEYDKPQKTNILKEFVKAKYNKYCPKIDWE